MVNYAIYFFLAFLLHHGAPALLGRDINPCPVSNCSDRGPSIRFPFRIKGKQPPDCGYPGFDLSCTDRNDTLLELPTSTKLLVNEIDYVEQMVSTSDPEGCLLRQLFNFSSTTASPFLEFQQTNGWDVVLLNCSKRERLISMRMYDIPCLGSLEYQVFAISAPLWLDVDLLSCTKLQTVRSVPYDLIDYSMYNKLNLSWSIPKCQSCERRGGQCGINHTSTKHGLHCYNLPLPKHNGVSAKAVAPGTILGLFMLVAAYALYCKHRGNKEEKEYEKKIENFLNDYKVLNPTRFSYADIKRITNEFKNVLGQGAYGTVYKGRISDEILVAVKVLNNSTGDHDGEEFVNEVGMMGKIHHVHVVRLVGFCADGFRRALVYEFLPNESLARFISSPDDKNNFLGWKRLQDIALGIAKGIEYLHQGCDQRILHFDIKPHNILLDENFNPKITDFGMAKLCAKDQSAVSMTTARGTIGYIAPEVFSRNFGNVSYKSDVYSFGMLVLEMVGGRKIADDKSNNSDQIYFPVWIYNILEQGEEDLRLEIHEEGDAKIAKKLAIVGLWCIQWNPADRPSMKNVIQMLEGEGDNLTPPPNPFNSAGPSRTNGSKPVRRVNQQLAVISETE